MVVLLLIVVQMSDADMQEYYDNFFEEVFVETNDKVAQRTHSIDWFFQ